MCFNRCRVLQQNLSTITVLLFQKCFYTLQSLSSIATELKYGYSSIIPKVLLCASIVLKYCNIAFEYCNIAFEYCNIAFEYCNIAFEYCNIAFEYCNIAFEYCNISHSRSSIATLKKRILGFFSSFAFEYCNQYI